MKMWIYETYLAYGNRFDNDEDYFVVRDLHIQ